jgi:hypothetical protein
MLQLFNLRFCLCLKNFYTKITLLGITVVSEIGVPKQPCKFCTCLTRFVRNIEIHLL